MKNFKIIKDAIHASLEKETFIPEDNDNGVANKLITGCLLYELLSSISNNETSSLNGLLNLANSYVSSYKSLVLEIKGKYISYMYMKKAIRSYEVIYFNQMTHEQINKICTLNGNKTLVEEFSESFYSPLMYNIMEISDSANKRLGSIHKNIMVPIYSHYKKKYNPEQKITIYDSLIVPSNPGKKILFELEGINNTKLIFDIFGRDILNIKKYIYSMKLYEKHILITIK